VGIQPDIPQRLTHQTLGMQRLAVHAEDYWEYKPEQRVQTTDGLPGTVKAVLDGPYPGSEEYQVELDKGMGGGAYTASQLRPAAATTAAMEQTAAADYPELSQILVERPDPAGMMVYAAKAAPFGDDDGKDDDSSDDDSDDGDDDSDDSDDDGDDDDSDDDSEDKDDNTPPWVKKDASALFASLITTAAADIDFRFQVTAAWKDVVAKAKRIRSEGGVRVTMASDGLVFADVKGDNEVYEAGLQRLPNKQAIHSWSCGCKWGAYHWGADDDFSKFAGRMCSHALALQYEAQSRGMFGRNVGVDETRPHWVPRKVVVKYDIDADKNRLAPSTAAYDQNGEYFDSGYDDHEEADRSKQWDDVHEGLEGIHRGIGIHLRPEDHAVVHDEDRPLHERAQHLLESIPRSHEGQRHGPDGNVGWHWSGSDGVGEDFANTTSHPSHPGPLTGVVFHGHKPDRGDINEYPDQREGDVYGYHDHGEQEVPLHHGSHVGLKGVSWKDMGREEDHPALGHAHPNGTPSMFFPYLGDFTHHTFGEHEPQHVTALRRGYAPLSVVARAAVKAGENRAEVKLAMYAAGIQATASDDDDAECETCTEPFYDGQSHECQHCGGEHHTNCCDYDTGHTDWDQVHPHLNGVHRGFAVNLPSNVHSQVHDPQKPVHERAHALLDSVADGNDGFGMHWSSNPSQAEHYAHVSHPDRGADGGHQSTHVMLHAKTPARDDIETDPDTLMDHHVIGYDKHDDHEVPIQRGADVHISGISWKEPHKHEWTRHDFDKPVTHLANADAPFGAPSGTSYELPKAPGATSPKMPWENPASAGNLAGADPVGWNRRLPLESYASLDDQHSLFEPGGTEATLNEEPEGALPETDGMQIPSNDEALSPSITGSLRRQALKDFTLAERQALIDEGEGVRAANLDLLKIEGTHYADLEQILAAQEDDTTWLE
jgi:hypothetical protein